MTLTCSTARQALAKIRKDLEVLQSLNTALQVDSAIECMRRIEKAVSTLQKGSPRLYTHLDQIGNARRDEIRKKRTVEFVFAFSEGKAIVRKNNQYAYIDSDGEFLSGDWYDEAQVFSQGRAGVRLDERWFFITADGSRLSNETYDSVEKFSRNRAAVKRGRKRFYIDLNGDRIKE